MSASPLAYLRGAAPLFYEILAARPDLADGPPGEGWITGDMHLENFGAYRPDPLEAGVGAKGERSTKRSRSDVVFDLNDFDDATVGPWRFDLVRLTTSLLLGGRELGASGVVALSLADRLLDAWASAAFDDAPLPSAPRPVRLLVEQVQSRSRAELLDARTRRRGGSRAFVRGPRYADLPGRVLERVPKAFARYMEELPRRDRPQKGSLEILDAALRIAGTGSLGALRVAVLVKGKGGEDGQWIFDLKEQGAPSAAELLGAPRELEELAPAARVVTALEACVERPPRMVAATKLTGASMLARKLTPQEDKLNLRRLDRADLPELACYLGALLDEGAADAVVGVGPRRGARPGYHARRRPRGRLPRALRARPAPPPADRRERRPGSLAVTR
jgi:uncharacterized protein (DUF2252 family)